LKLSKEIKRLLMMNASSNIIFNYIGIFVNLYIWQENKSIFDVAWFNLIQFVTWTLCFLLGSFLISRYSNRILIRAIALCGAATFLLLTFLHLDNRLLWIASIAVPVGAMWGFYASAQNLTLSLYGKGKDFESYFSVSSVLGQTISVVNPVVFALVIQWLGFSGSFLLMFLFVLILLWVSFLIPSITLAREGVPLARNLSFGKVFSTTSLKWLVPSCMAAGVFLQFQSLFALLFTFSVSKDKLVIALLNVLYTCFAMCAMLLYRKMKVKENVWLAVGMGCLSVGFLIVLFPAAPILVISNILTTVGMFYFATVWNTRQFAVISRSTPIEQARIFMWRECLLNLSRILVNLLVLNVKDFHGGMFIFLLGLALSCASVIPYLSGKGIDTFAGEKNNSADMSA